MKSKKNLSKRVLETDQILSSKLQQHWGKLSELADAKKQEKQQVVI